MHYSFHDLDFCNTNMYALKVACIHLFFID